MADEIFTKVIGYHARLRGTQLFCSGPACLIASSEGAMKEAIRTVNPEDARQCIIRKTRLIDILNGLASGAPYAFDQGAYQRFHPLAYKEGLTKLPNPEKWPTDTPYIIVSLGPPSES